MRLRRILIPDGLVIVAGLLATQIAAVRAALDGLAITLVAATVLVGALLSLRFHRGRMLLLLLMLAFGTWSLAATAAASSPTRQATLALLAILLPLNMAVISLLPERGALTLTGLVRLGVFAAEALAAVTLVRWAAVPTAAALHYAMVPADAMAWTALPQSSLSLATAAALLFFTLWLREPSPIARGMLWSLVGAMIALHTAARGGDPAIWFAIAAAVLALAIIESSYLLAYHDPLTGLPGRRALTEALQRTGNGFAVAMVDVDHFKACNDRWGHDVGDQVLRMVAARLEAVGGAGRAFRYGGEEFALLFPGLSAALARPHVEQLLQAVEASSFAIRLRPRPHKKPARRAARDKKSQQVAVTISAGLAEGDGSFRPEAVLDAADQALYRAKENGRNRVEG